MPGDGSGRPHNPWDCEKACWRHGELQEGERASRGCTRADLPPVGWDVEEDRLMGHLGRAYDPAREQHPLETDDHPFEDFEDGCPGGDQRCRFVLTLLAFGYRRRDANANRVSHPRFDRCTNDLVIDALMFFEMHEDRNDAECDRVRSDHLRKKADRGG